MATGTNNPVGSDDPRDVRANAKNFDLLSLGDQESYPDRKGVQRLSWAGMEARFEGIDPESFYQDLGDYTAGIEVARENQLIRKDGDLYRIADAGDLPYTTTGDWPTDSVKFDSVGDIALRQDLAGPDGASKVGYAGINVSEWLDKLQVNGAGATQKDYSANALLRYDIQEINESTVSRGAQAFAFDEAKRRLYLLESDRISRYALDGDDLAYPIDSTAAGGTALGHQGLAVERGTGKLWTTSAVGGRYAVRFDYVAGLPVTAGEVYELFDGNNVFANSTSCTPAISVCGRFLVAHGTVFGQVSNTKVRVFEIATLLDHGPGDCTDLALYEFSTQNLVDSLNPLQGMACDGENIYCIAGGTGFTPDVNKRLHVFSLAGDLISKDQDITIGRAAALLDATGTRYEPEGMDVLFTAGGGLTLMVGILSGDPGSRRYRIYACGMGKPVIANEISLIGNHKGLITSTRSTGRDYVAIRARFDLTQGSGSNWYGSSDSGSPGAIADFTNNLTRRVTGLNGTTLFKADSGYPVLQVDGPASGQLVQMYRNGVHYGAINVSTVDIGLHALNGAMLRFATAAAGIFAGVTRWVIENVGNLVPFIDNAYDIGSETLNVRKIHSRNIVLKPAASEIPSNNGELTFQLTNNTTLEIKVKGSDGVVRSGTITLV